LELVFARPLQGGTCITITKFLVNIFIT
jgi:hypothetical protein